jgi:hypothetical protein
MFYLLYESSVPLRKCSFTVRAVELWNQDAILYKTGSRQGGIQDSHEEPEELATAQSSDEKWQKVVPVTKSNDKKQWPIAAIDSEQNNELWWTKLWRLISMEQMWKTTGGRPQLRKIMTDGWHFRKTKHSSSLLFKHVVGLNY